jgi:dipeptidyl-peptidase-4
MLVTHGRGVPSARIRFAAMIVPVILTAASIATDPCRAAVPRVAPLARSIVTPTDTSFLDRYAATYHFTLGRPTSIHLTPSGDQVLFLRSGPRSFVQDLWSFDTKTGRERVLLTAERVLAGAAEKLTADERARRERLRQASRGIASFQLSEDGRRILVPLSGRLFVIARATGTVAELPSAAGAAEDARFSPDGEHVACVRDGDLYVTDVGTRRERRLTRRESDTITNGRAEFVAQEEMDRFEGYWWSPDSRSIVFERADASGVEIFHLLDPSRPEQAPQSWPYPRPGKTNVRVGLAIVPIAGGKTTWVRWDDRRFPYLCRVLWRARAPLTVLVMNREQTEEALLTADAATGATRALFTESDPAWLELDRTTPRWLEDGSGLLWTSDRTGTRRLELRDKDGNLARVLTPSGLEVEDVLDADTLSGYAWITASDEPTQRHLWRVPLDPHRGAPLRVSLEPGIHHAEFARGHRRYVQTVEALAGRREWIVRDAGGRRLGRLRSVAEPPPFMPRLEFTLAGPRDFHAVLIRPRSFDSRRLYPVIVSVYGGPTSQMVMASPWRYLLQQWLADHGYIVVSLDGRGTPGRGRQWSRWVRHDLIGSPLADQVEGIRALAKKYRELDLSRVGIYGWSFGGYFSAMAVMRRPDLFRAAIAGAPVADWRDYDTFYSERYLGLPSADPKGYDSGSVLTYVSLLTRPLLVIHGVADDNVYFMHSLKLCAALNAAGRPYDMMPLVGRTHMVADPAETRNLNQRILGFFELHLR